MVFVCGAEERHPTNTLPRLRLPGTVWLGDCFGEWVEVADDDENRRDFLRFEVFGV